MMGISFYKYEQKYKYKELLEEFEILENKDININILYAELIKGEFKIINEEKKIIINDYKEIKLQNEIKITDH